MPDPTSLHGGFNAFDPVPRLTDRVRDLDGIPPVVGARRTADFRNRWALELRGDVGGLGVSSDHSRLFRLGAGWRFARPWYFRFGWMIVDVDYEDGTGFSRFK